MRTRRNPLAGAALALAMAMVWLPPPGGRPARAGEAEALALVEAYVAAWNAHDAATAASFFAEDGAFFDVTVGKAQQGPADIQANVMQSYLAAVPDLTWTREGEPVVEPDGATIAFEWTLSGTNTGPWADGTAPTGNPFKIRGVTFMRLKGDRIAYQGDYYDALGFYQQLGLLE